MQLLSLLLCLGLALRGTFTRPTSNVALGASANRHVQARGDTYGSYPFWNPPDIHPTSVGSETPTARGTTPTETAVVEWTVSQSVSPTTAETNAIPTTWTTTLTDSVILESTVTASVSQNTGSQGTSTIRESTVTETVITKSTVTASVPCDRVRKFQKPTPKDWEEHGMDKKFKAWRKKMHGL